MMMVMMILEGSDVFYNKQNAVLQFARGTVRSVNKRRRRHRRSYDFSPGGTVRSGTHASAVAASSSVESASK